MLFLIWLVEVWHKQLASGHVWYGWKYQHTIHPSIHTCPALRSVEGLVPLLAIIEWRWGTHWTSQCVITRQISDQYNSRGIIVQGYIGFKATVFQSRFLFLLQHTSSIYLIKLKYIIHLKTGLGLNEVCSIFFPKFHFIFPKFRFFLF